MHRIFPILFDFTQYAIFSSDIWILIFQQNKKQFPSNICIQIQNVVFPTVNSCVLGKLIGSKGSNVHTENLVEEALQPHLAFPSRICKGRKVRACN